MAWPAEGAGPGGAAARASLGRGCRGEPEIHRLCARAARMDGRLRLVSARARSEISGAAVAGARSGNAGQARAQAAKARQRYRPAWSGRAARSEKDDEKASLRCRI